MSKLSKPNNDWSRVLWILHQSYMGGVSMATVLNKYLPNFYKFQTRLSEIQREYPNLKISKAQIPFKNTRMNKTGYFTQYTPISPQSYILNLYNQINENGLKQPTKTK